MEIVRTVKFNNQSYNFIINKTDDNRLDVDVKKSTEPNFYNVGIIHGNDLTVKQYYDIITFYNRITKETPKNKLEACEDAWHPSYNYYGDGHDNRSLFIEFRDIEDKPRVDLYYNNERVYSGPFDIDWCLCDEYNIERMAEKWWKDIIIPYNKKNKITKIAESAKSSLVLDNLAEEKFVGYNIQVPVTDLNVYTNGFKDGFDEAIALILKNIENNNL